MDLLFENESGFAVLVIKLREAMSALYYLIVDPDDDDDCFSIGHRLFLLSAL